MLYAQRRSTTRRTAVKYPSSKRPGPSGMAPVHMTPRRTTLTPCVSRIACTSASLIVHFDESAHVAAGQSLGSPALQQPAPTSAMYGAPLRT